MIDFFIQSKSIFAAGRVAHVHSRVYKNQIFARRQSNRMRKSNSSKANGENKKSQKK